MPRSTLAMSSAQPWSNQRVLQVHVQGEPGSTPASSPDLASGMVNVGGLNGTTPDNANLPVVSTAGQRKLRATAVRGHVGGIAGHIIHVTMA